MGSRGFGKTLKCFQRSRGGLFNTVSLIGVASLLISSMLWALGSIYSRKSFLPQNFLLAAGKVTLVGGALLIIPSFLIGEFNQLTSFSDIDLDLLISYIFLIFIGTVVPFAEFYGSLKGVHHQ